MGLRILLVTQDAFVANTLIRSLEPQGCTVVLRDTFKTAAAELAGANTDLVIADVKLAPFNGIHLAIRARALNIETIVFGPDDPVLKRDAAAAGAEYVNTSLVPAVLGSGLLRRGPGDTLASDPLVDFTPSSPLAPALRDLFVAAYPTGKKRVVH